MALKPLHDRVLVRRIESDEKTSGGLIIPDSAKEKPAEGIIVACGEGARKDSGELIENFNILDEELHNGCKRRQVQLRRTRSHATRRKYPSGRGKGNIGTKRP